jgi:hypothetical protein
MFFLMLSCLTLTSGQAVDQGATALHSTLAQLPRNAMSGQAQHEHLQGEFFRQAKMQPRFRHLTTQSFGAIACYQ